MDVRDARPEDAEVIATVARASWHAAYDDLLGPETVDATVAEWYATDSLRAEIRQIAEDHGGVFLVAVANDPADDGDVVGLANAVPASGDDPPADAFFSRLYVLPDNWGEGAGFDLTTAVRRRLLDVGHDSVWLEVFAENEVGRSFYEGLGFERFDAVDETMGGTTLTALHLRASLTKVAGLGDESAP